MNSYNIMAHMIPGFPDLERSRRVARALVDGGAAYLEVQFPYSDPTADGPEIQGATAIALANGFTVDTGWGFVGDLLRGDVVVPVFVMSYAGLVYARGVERFVQQAAEQGVTGLIVPDLPLDSDEGLVAAGRRFGVEVVPVIALGAGPDRIELVHRARTRYIYASLRRGITGTHTTIGEENIAFMEELGRNGAQVLAGFGISTNEQVRAVTEHAHAAVVGSAFVRAVYQAAVGDPYDVVRAATERLVRGPD